MSEAKSEAHGEGKSKGGGAAKFIGLALALVNLGVVGGGAYLTYAATLGFEAPSLREPAAIEALRKEREATSEKADPILFTMEPFIANLAGTRRQTIRVAVTLQMLDQDGYEEVVANNPAARDAIVRILNGTAFADVESIQGKLYLKDEIAVALNGFLKRGVVRDIYFNDFVVQ